MAGRAHAGKMQGILSERGRGRGRGGCWPVQMAFQCPPGQAQDTQARQIRKCHQ